MSFWSFPEIPKGPESKEALLIVPLIFTATLLWVIAKLIQVAWLSH